MLLWLKPPPMPPPMPCRAAAVDADPAVTAATAASTIAILRIMMFTPFVASRSPAFAKVDDGRGICARDSAARFPRAGIRAPELGVVGKLFERRLAARRLQ